MTTKTQNKKDFLNKLSENLQNDICEHVSHLEEITDFEELQEELEENDFFNVEIIYYYKAANYLLEHDPSFTESLEIAEEYDFQVKNLNSEVLASLHASQSLREDFYQLEEEIEDFFTNLNN